MYITPLFDSLSAYVAASRRRDSFFCEDFEEDFEDDFVEREDEIGELASSPVEARGGVSMLELFTDDSDDDSESDDILENRKCGFV
jgi:hypothetical protein